MRVRLKGLNRVTKTLADGRRVTYHYAWKGGPRLEGRPGDAVFIASYNKAIANLPRRRGSYSIGDLADAYLDSVEFSSKAPRTQRDYRKQMAVIVREFGDAPVRDLGDPNARPEFLLWRDQLAKCSKRQADYAWTVLALVFAWGVDRGLAPNNPCKRGGRLYRENRADKVWSEDQINRFVASAPAHVVLALQLALWTGQRQGDLLALTWFAYSGGVLSLTQGKTRRRVTVPVATPLKVLLDKARAEQQGDGRILRTSAGEDWTPDGFRSSWDKACSKAEIVGVTFNDLRGTAVLRMCLAGCSVPEIATLTGHSLNDVRSILDVHYFHRDTRLGVSAIEKLEKAFAEPVSGTVNPGSLKA